MRKFKANDEVTKNFEKFSDLYTLRNFNFNKIDWNNPNLAFMVKPFNLNSDNPNLALLSHNFLRLLYAINLSQLVTFPTQLSKTLL